MPMVSQGCGFLWAFPWPPWPERGHLRSPGFLCAQVFLGGYLGRRGGHSGHGRHRRRLPLQFVHPFCQLSDRRCIFHKLALDPLQQAGEVLPPEPQLRVFGLKPLHGCKQLGTLLGAARRQGEKLG